MLLESSRVVDIRLQAVVHRTALRSAIASLLVRRVLWGYVVGNVRQDRALGVQHEFAETAAIVVCHDGREVQGIVAAAAA